MSAVACAGCWFYPHDSCIAMGGQDSSSKGGIKVGYCVAFAREVPANQIHCLLMRAMEDMPPGILTILLIGAYCICLLRTQGNVSLVLVWCRI